MRFTGLFLVMLLMWLRPTPSMALTCEGVHKGGVFQLVVEFHFTAATGEAEAKKLAFGTSERTTFLRSRGLALAKSFEATLLNTIEKEIPGFNEALRFKAAAPTLGSYLLELKTYDDALKTYQYLKSQQDPAGLIKDVIFSDLNEDDIL